MEVHYINNSPFKPLTSLRFECPSYRRVSSWRKNPRFARKTGFLTVELEVCQGSLEASKISSVFLLDKPLIFPPFKYRSVEQRARWGFMMFHSFIKELLSKLYWISKCFTHIKVCVNIYLRAKFQGHRSPMAPF